MALTEWWQESPPGTPHTFKLLLTLSGMDGNFATADFVNDVIDEVTRTKPVRSHFTFTQGIQSRSGIGIVAAVRIATYTHLQFSGVKIWG